MKAVLLVISALLITWSTFAQFNDTTHYHLMVASNGSINKTDGSSAYLLNNTLNLGVKTKSVMINASNVWVYGKQNNSLTNNDFSSTLYADVNTGVKHLYYWGLLNYNTSYSLKISDQLLAGAGLAYDLIDKDSIRLNLSDGILYDQSSLLTLKDYHTYRNSLRVQLRFMIKDMVTFESVNFLQSALNDGNDYIIKSNTTLGLKLRKWISLTTTLGYNKMNITGTQNLTLTYGLALDKFF